MCSWLTALSAPRLCRAHSLTLRADRIRLQRVYSIIESGMLFFPFPLYQTLKRLASPIQRTGMTTVKEIAYFYYHPPPFDLVEEELV